MSDEVRGWRAVPTLLLLGFALDVAHVLVFSGRNLVYEPAHYSIRIGLVDSGLRMAATVLFGLGALDLARGLTGRAALGARIAAAAYGLELVLLLAWRVAFYFAVRGWHGTEFFELSSYLWFAASLGSVVGFALAAWHRRALAAGALALALVVHPEPQLGRLLFRWLDLGYHGAFLLHATLLLALYGVTFAVVASAARGRSTPDTGRAAEGLRRAAAAMWWRVIAAVTVTTLTLLVIAGNGTGGESVLELAMVTGAVINLIALAQFALGALAIARSEVHDVPRWGFALAGAATLWCAGVLAAKMPELILVFNRDARSGFGRDAREGIEALSLAVPLVAAVAIAAVAAGIGAFAARRGLSALCDEATSKGAAFVALMLVTLAIQSLLLPDAHSRGAFVGLTLAAAGAGLWATVLIARLCGAAAAEVEAEPGLPTATVISGGA